MTMTGRMLTIGPASATPRRLAPNPSWNTVTTAPNDAPMVSRNPPIAVSGIRIERKASINRSSARPTTTLRYGDQGVGHRLRRVDVGRGLAR